MIIIPSSLLYNYNNYHLYLGLFSMYIETFNCILNTVSMTITWMCISLAFRCMIAIRKISRSYSHLFLHYYFCVLLHVSLWHNLIYISYHTYITTCNERPGVTCIDSGRYYILCMSFLQCDILANRNTLHILW